MAARCAAAVGVMAAAGRRAVVIHAAEVAEEAHRVGRQRLAMMLLEEFETAPSEQVCCVCVLCAKFFLLHP